MVLDEIPDSMITPPLMSADIAHMSVRQKMLQELEDSRESVLQMERVHQQEIAKLKEMLECAKVERRNERSLLQQKITSLHKVITTHCCYNSTMHKGIMNKIAWLRIFVVENFRNHTVTTKLLFMKLFIFQDIMIPATS